MKRLLSATAFLAISTAAQAGFYDPDFSDAISCYAYVHEQCYPGGGDNECPDGWYEDGLDSCDVAFPSASVEPVAPTNLASPGTKRSDRKTVNVRY